MNSTYSLRLQTELLSLQGGSQEKDCECSTCLFLIFVANARSSPIEHDVNISVKQEMRKYIWN